MESDPLFVLAGLLAAGVGAQWLASRLHLPSIVLLLATGLLLGPVTGVLAPSALFGDLFGPIVSLSVAIVLFEGGLSLRVSEARKLGWPLIALVLGGLTIAFGLGTLGAHYIGGLSWPVAALLGGILVVTGPTVVKPLLRIARLKQRPAHLLRWEGIVNDPFGALLAVAVLEAVLLQQSSDGVTLAAVADLIARVLGAGLAGGAFGWLLGVALNRAWIADHLVSPMILAGVLVAFAGADALLHEAGLLAVTVMGVVLGNMSTHRIEAIRHFKEDVATLLIGFLFIVLAADLTFDDLQGFTLGTGLFVLAVLFLVRPITVHLSLLGSKVTAGERNLIGWIAPRGVVAAAMGGALAPVLEKAGYADARLVLPVLFGVIILTVVLHGITIGPFARKLGVAGGKGGGVLLVGATTWGIDLARTLGDAGVDVIVVDAAHQAVTQARLRGLEAEWGDPLHEDVLDDLPLERIDLVLAATPDDKYNKLVALALAKNVGRDHVLQVTPTEEAAPHLMGRTPWGEAGSYAALSSRYWGGRRFRTSELTEQYDGEAFRAQNEDALVLFVVSETGVKAVGESDELPVGAKVVWTG